MLIVVQIVGALVAVIFVGYLAALCFGLYLLRKGQHPFDPVALEAEGGRYVTTPDGRKIEYFVYGNPDKDAPVVVNLHGSGTEAMSELKFYRPICEALGVKGIAISLPGYGYTDMLPGRVVKDWPEDDLEPVLTAEGVDRFMITGHSQGNPHAMAAAFHFGGRCVGLGLNAPLLPAPLSKEVGVKGAIGMDSLPRTESLKKPYMAWYFALFHLSLVTLAPWIPLKGMVAGRPNIAADGALMRRMRESVTRGVVRGSVGSTWETAGDVCYEWGFDPRLIETNNVCVWHAADDNLCPPEIGQWLAEMFRTKEGVRVDFRADDLGFGHFTYVRGEFAEAETSMIKALLDGLPPGDSA